jgi:ubiquinone/menaquinone biosynthesis C-methylase UbiE
MAARSPFDPVAADYDAGRPGYPDGLFTALEESTGPLAGALVLDAGAGTGIATRQLAARGARAIALDIGEQMLRRAQARSPDMNCLLADGNAIPIRSESIDLACFAQSWHWFDPERASWEVARVLRPGGHWTAWWSHAWADGQPWFDTYQGLPAPVTAVITATPTGARRASRRPGCSRRASASRCRGPGCWTWSSG